jgi:hypothetical protein
MEVAQKQKYIFQTNRLAENIGASIIIREVTEELPDTFSTRGERVYRGGGKSVYAFLKEEDAKDFTYNLSKAVMEKYPGVDLYMTTDSYDTDHESIISAIDRLYGKLEAKKSAKASSFRLYGLGITEQCDSTQLPAFTRNIHGQLLSQESDAKFKKAEREKDMIFGDLLPENQGYRFASEFAELGGTKGTKNYIAITVMDGNKMGKKLEKFREDFIKTHPVIDASFNSEYKKEIRKVSEKIDAVYKKAVRNTVLHLSRSLDQLIARGVLTGIRKGGKVLPFRPLILAGDDICFVSDARIGVAVAEEVMREIEKEDFMGIPMKVCAGTVMVKTSYPFFRAHELAEELCQSAKSVLPADDSRDASVIDFHFVQGEISGSLTEIRKSKYKNNTLTSKPYYLNQEDGGVCMQMFRDRLSVMKKNNWARSLIKEYRSALAAGENEAKRFLIHKRVDQAAFGESYQNGRCRDFDVIEMMDIYHELEESL